MSSPDNKTVDTAIEKACKDPTFTTEEVAALKSIADTWRGLQAFGRLAVVVQKVAMWLGWAIGAYILFQTFVADWLRSALR